MLHTQQTDNVPTIDDSTYSHNILLAEIEERAIVEDFQLDFGFSLEELPNLDLPLSAYEDELEIMAMHEERPHWDDSTDAFDRVSESDVRMYTEGFVRFSSYDYNGANEKHIAIF
jgi:hypothetical protein